MDPYLWDELVDWTRSWEAAEQDQRQRAERLARITFEAGASGDAARQLAGMTSGILAEALEKLARHLDGIKGGG